MYTKKQLEKMAARNGGGLDLSGTSITALPDNLTVGGGLDLSGTSIENRDAYKRLRDGDYMPGCYLYADSILTHVKRKKRCGDYTVYVGKIHGRNVVSDGTHYAHCDKIRDGIADLLYKSAAERGAEQYRGYNLDTLISAEDAITMYRVITGACRAGTAAFVESLGELKRDYTIREVIETTRGQYNSVTLRRFFNVE